MKYDLNKSKFVETKEKVKKNNKGLTKSRIGRKIGGAERIK